MGRKKKEQPIPLSEHLNAPGTPNSDADVSRDGANTPSLAHVPVEQAIDILHLGAVKYFPGINGSIQIIDAKKHQCQIWMAESGIVTVEKNGYKTYVAPTVWHTADVYPETQQQGLTDVSNVAAHSDAPPPMFTTTDGTVEAAPASNAMVYRQRSRYM